MVLPILLIVLALLAALGYALGTQPTWGAYHHGIDIIIWSRRLEWPMLVTALLLCLAMAGMVIAGKKRAWWMLAFAPVLVLLFHRLSHSPSAGLVAMQDPPFITPAQATSLPASDLVVGVIVEGKPTAFACTSLSRCPIVLRTGRDKPMVLLWSPWANRALAFQCDRELRAADLQIVCGVQDTWIIYNSRLGEFINSMTGLKFDRSTPTGFHAQLPVVKTTWANWLALHPDTVIAAMQGGDGDFSKPLVPKDALPGASSSEQRRVCVVACTQPIAVPDDAVADKPMNLDSAQTPVLLVRVNGVLRAFSRELPGDLIPRFSPTADPKHKNVVWVDSDTNSEWSDNGAVVVEGTKDMHGATLRPLPVEDDLYWNVMKFWYPELNLATDDQIKASTVVETHPTEKPTTRPRRRRGG